LEVFVIFYFLSPIFFVEFFAISLYTFIPLPKKFSNLG